MQESITKIAVIGLGIMGAPIAIRLQNRFNCVHGYDPAQAARDSATACGVFVAATVAECVTGADFVLTVLPTVDISRQVLEQFLEFGRSGAVLIEHGTIGSDAARRHARLAQEKGLKYLDAPVINGGQQAAQAGTLKILAGGDEQVVSCAEPVLRAYSTETLHMGPVGTAQTMKLINNMLLAAISSASAEALALAERAGIGAQRAYSVLSESSTRSFALEWLFPAAVQGDFSGGAKIDILVKDMHLAMAEASLYSARIPFTQLSSDLFEECRSNGWGLQDMSIVLKLLSETPKQSS